MGNTRWLSLLLQGLDNDYAFLFDLRKDVLAHKVYSGEINFINLLNILFYLNWKNYQSPKQVFVKLARIDVKKTFFMLMYLILLPSFSRKLFHCALVMASYDFRVSLTKSRCQHLPQYWMSLCVDVLN